MNAGACMLVYDLGKGPVERTLAGGRVVLGRGNDCDVVLNATAVSRRHAAMECSEGSWRIADLGSLNGVWVNGERVRTRRLSDNDRIEIGSVKLSFRSLVSGETRVGNTRVVIEPTASAGLSRSTTQFRVVDFDPFTAGAKAPETTADESEDAPVDDAAWLMRLLSDATERIVAAESLDEMLDGLLELAMSRIEAERGAVFLYSPEADVLIPKAVCMPNSADEELIVSEVFTREVLRRRSSLMVNGISAAEQRDQDEAAAVGDVGSVLSAPLYREGETTGVIYLDSRRADAFEAADLRVLSSMALIAATGVSQMRLREMVASERRRREQLQRYLPHHVVDSMMERGRAALPGMVPCEREVTVLFCDLHRFTRIAESLPATEVAALLNDIFDDLTRIIFELDGTLDKFTGDGLIAFFGAPFPQQDHARRAVLAALEMRAAVGRFDAEKRIEFPLRMRFGINTGSVIAGDIGAAIRCDYTVLGDVVNVASRFESTVAEPGEIIIGAATRALLGDEFEVEELSEVAIRGRIGTERPFRVTSVPGR